jgi:hypothetical protein
MPPTIRSKASLKGEELLVVVVVIEGQNPDKNKELNGPEQTARGLR